MTNPTQRFFMVKVTGCMNCLYKYKSDSVSFWCGKYPRNETEPVSLINENYSQITESCPMYPQSQSQGNVLPALKGEASLNRPMMLALPLITGEPVGYRYRNDEPDGWTYASAKTVEMFLSDSVTKEPLYTHPQPLQAITVNDVTDQMVIAVCSAVNLRIGAWGMAKPRELIAAAYNAVLDGMIKHRGDTK